MKSALIMRLIFEIVSKIASLKTSIDIKNEISYKKFTLLSFEETLFILYYDLLYIRKYKYVHQNSRIY